MSNNSGEQGYCAFYQGHHRSASLSFPSRFISLGLCRFYLVCKHQVPEEAFQGGGRLQRTVLPSERRGPGVPAPGCHRGAGRMRLWSGFCLPQPGRLPGEHPALQALVKKERLCREQGRNRDLRLSPHTNVSPDHPQPNVKRLPPAQRPRSKLTCPLGLSTLCARLREHSLMPVCAGGCLSTSSGGGDATHSSPDANFHLPFKLQDGAT